MSTRTAIFQECEDGKYRGIYVHHDGYVEGVGQVLETHFQDYDKTKELIGQKQPLSVLGATTHLVKQSYPITDEQKATVTKDGFEWYENCLAIDEDRGEYFVARTINDITNDNMLCYDNKGDIQGFRNQYGEYQPITGVDNNGFYYIQYLNGMWTVATMEYDGNWVTQPLNDALTK